jgi:hypothetical protein
MQLVVSGDPEGHPDFLPELIQEHERHAQTRGIAQLLDFPT